MEDRRSTEEADALTERFLSLEEQAAPPIEDDEAAALVSSDRGRGWAARVNGCRGQAITCSG